MNSQKQYDVAIIGGGPSGSTAAILLAKAGCSVVMMERQAFPRFHIGESLLPKNMELFKRLGVKDKILKLPHTEKHGVEFAFGHETESSKFAFINCLGNSETMAVNIARAPFDKLLLDEAEAAGVTVAKETAVKDILKLADDDVRLKTDQGEVQARYVIDASGQATLLGKHLKTRKVVPDMKKVSYFAHYKGVERHCGKREGYPTIIMMEDGWFWIIPLDKETTSIGLVIDHTVTKSIKQSPQEILELAISKCPMLAHRMRDAERVSDTHAMADFSYQCKPYAGEGYFLVGDAATFLDPVFSTGVVLGMMSSARAAEGIISILKEGKKPQRARAEYTQYLENSSKILFSFVRDFYRHSFREIMLFEDGPFKVRNAIASILAGNVFPTLVFKLKWRYWLFQFLHRLQAYYPLVPKRESHSMFQ